MKNSCAEIALTMAGVGISSGSITQTLHFHVCPC
jgi:hypothetical protein